jgi:hypothetical protein
VGELTFDSRLLLEPLLELVELRRRDVGRLSGVLHVPERVHANRGEVSESVLTKRKGEGEEEGKVNFDRARKREE